MVSANIDTDVLCAQYMQQMMANCHCIIGSSLTEDSEIIEEDIEVIHPNREIDSDIEDDFDDEEEWDEDDCDEDNCECCKRNCPFNR
jgi:hypothetical protein